MENENKTPETQEEEIQATTVFDVQKDENKEPEKPKKKRLKKGIYIVLIIIFAGIALFSGYKILTTYLAEQTALKDEQSLQIPVETIQNNAGEEYRKLFDQFKSDNDAFVGWLAFDSGLVNQPVVLGEDNDFYLNHNFHNEYSIYGTVFMDAGQTVDDPNITIYGHYVYGNADLMFSPLTLLASEENYEANSTFTFSLENEKRSYVVAAVIQYDTAVDVPYYQMGQMTEEELAEFLAYIPERQMYDTGVTISATDHFVCLQTCVRNQESKRWVIIGKLVDTEPIE